MDGDHDDSAFYSRQWNHLSGGSRNASRFKRDICAVTICQIKDFPNRILTPDINRVESQLTSKTEAILIHLAEPYSRSPSRSDNLCD